MSQTLTAEHGVRHSVLPSTRSFLVTRQSPDGSRGFEPLGALAALDEGRWSFQYVRQVVDGAVRPLPGVPVSAYATTVPYLFPVFAQRVLSPRREDREKILHELDLAPDAGAFEILQRNGGRRQGDSIELIRMPEYLADGQVSVEFLVHGVRHRSPLEQESIGHLVPGDPVDLRAEPGNAHDPWAHKVLVHDETTVGWVPAPLTQYVESLAERRAEVIVAHGNAVDPHLRLLVRLEGRETSGSIVDQPPWEFTGV